MRPPHILDSMRKNFATWTAAVLFAAVLCAAVLSGCAPSDTGLQPGAARQLQARVLEVSEASARNDMAAAMLALEGLEAELAAAQDRGQISGERRRTITTIAAAVRADVQAAVEAARAAEEAKIAAEQAAASATTDTPAPAPAPAPEPAPAPIPEPAPAPEAGNIDDKKDNQGKGKSKD